MPLEVIDSVSNDWQFEFDTSIVEWNQSEVLNMSVTAVEDDARTRKRCPMVSGKVRVCNDSYGGTGWAGLASINLDNQGHIVQGTAKMNDFYTYDANFKRHVMCQEIGHDFGLGHTSEDGSSQNTCMDYSNSPTSISPNAHDYQQLLAQHDHFDSYDSFVSGNGGGGTGCKGGPKKCGFTVPVGVPPGALRVNKNPFSETWVARDAEDGSYWVYHVRYAPGHERDFDH